MTSKKFVVQLIELYGDWPGPGMKNAVAEKMIKWSSKRLQRLAMYILEWYKPTKPGPPVFAEILSFAREMPDDHSAALPEPELTEEEKREVTEGLRDLLDDLEKKKRARPIKSKGGK